ncbi:MAG TPA: 2Fe-2S iron-sulfur cluster-binding protein [bacterium]|nr:2Fe-2S iron-sulfur cluster-binding protein [bacterium]HPR87021.1 2Fe-2S iron-sulfur cluster-binding protein [bacterium]
MPTFTIDGKEIEAAAGTSILKAALAHGIEIPHYCYHPALTIAGSCRMCLVELEGSPKLVLSCATEIKEGMVVLTQTEQVKDARRSMLEFFLINHPLDCPICDKAGECLLQDYTFKYGSSHSRMVEDKRVRPTKDLGGNILLYRNRCVLCTRCVRFYTDVVGEPWLTVENRGYHSDISIFPGRGLTHKMTGNIVEICPVGCLIDKDFLFNARVWNLNRTRSICSSCSSGCNISIEHKENAIYRIRARENAAVNGPWICDDGRYSYRAGENQVRLLAPRDKTGAVLSIDAALQQLSAHLRRLAAENRLAEVAIAGSAHATVEDNYVLRRLLGEDLGVKTILLNAPAPEGSDITYKSGFTIRADKSPNRRGAQLALSSSQDLWAELQQGRIRTLLMIGAPYAAPAAAQLQLLDGLEMLVVWSLTENDLARQADIALPMAGYAEQEGTFVNAQGRLQRLHAALEPPAGIRPVWSTLGSLGRLLGQPLPLNSAADVFNDLASRLPGFAGLSYFRIADVGIQLS